MKVRARELATLGIAIVFALVLAEIGLRVFWPEERSYHVIRPHTRATFHPSPEVLTGVSGPALYAINSQGIRGRELDPTRDEYRILAVGGSTTELLYLDEPETWPALVEASLTHPGMGKPVWVGSVGRSGMNARDHAVQVKFLLRQPPPLDEVWVLTGVNDLTVALAQGDSYVAPAPITDPVAERAQIRRAFHVAPGSLHEPGTDDALLPGAPWYKGTATYQLLKRVRFATRRASGPVNLVQDPRGDILLRWRAHRRSASSLLDTLPDLTAALTEYRRNLERIVEVTRASSVRLVLLTQPFAWRAGMSRAEEEKLWLGGVGDFQVESGKPYYTPRVLADGMTKFNETMLAVCRDRDVECVDLASQLPKDTLTFYDDVHFTELGARLVAQAIVRSRDGGAMPRGTPSAVRRL